jgi:outer membrane protein TolC
MTRLLQAAITGFVSAALAGGLAAQQTAPAPPSTQLQVSLAEAVRRALDVQPAMIQARGDQRNAGAGQRSAVGAFLPTITANGSSNLASTSRYNAATGQIVTVPSNTSYSGSLGLSLDLFDGFQRLASKRAAAATQDAADAGLVNQRYQVTATTAQLFFTALADEELVRVAEAQLQRAKEELQIAVNKFQVGAATRSDTLTATVDFGNAQLALLEAQANLATSQANLGRQVGVDQPVRAVPDTTFASLPDTTALRAEALDSSPQVQQAEARARAAGAQVGVARSQYWPTLSASYANGYTGLDSLGRVGLAPWSTTQTYVNNWALRFSLSWTLFNGFTREANQVASSVAQDVARAQAADTRRQLGAQLTQQLAAVFTASAQIKITGANVAAATEALRVTQERYRLGAGTLLDLLTAEANMTQAQVNQVQARYNYLIARAQVEALVGHPL